MAHLLFALTIEEDEKQRLAIAASGCYALISRDPGYRTGGVREKNTGPGQRSQRGRGRSRRSAMKRRRTGAVIGIALAAVLALAGCSSRGSSASVGAGKKGSGAETSVSAAGEQAGGAQGADAESTTVSSGSDTLVVYFSCTGNTRAVAEKIARVTGGDLQEIVPEDPYTDEDLDYNDDDSRSTREQNDPDVRPAITGAVENWDACSTVYVGYPIWWGEEPRILDTFAETYDFSGKTVIPFCTSGGSGIGSSGSNLEKLAGSGTWLAGERLSADSSEKEISDWVEGLP